MSVYSVAVDGPSGAGKSTLSKAVAKELGIVYVDTGAIYRSIGYYIYKNGMDPKDAAAVVAVLPQIRVDMRYSDDGLQHMLLNGEDVTEQIRLPEISMYASAVSAIPAVRTFLLEMQRDMARRSSVIMDGRDIGTVVLPKATVKFFLTASPEVRAKRRTKELLEKGQKADYEKILKDIQQRDYQDTHREVAPLKMTRDSVKLDTSDMTIDEVIAAMKETIAKKVAP